MTDDIKKAIAKTTDRKKVFKLLQQMTQKLNQVEFHSQSAKGEIWIDKGTKIFRATTERSGENGLLAMMELLSAQGLSFYVQPMPVEKPKTNVDAEVLLADLATNEAEVIDRIKAILWPVNESNIETEGAIPPIPVEESKDLFDPKTTDILTEPVISESFAPPIDDKPLIEPTPDSAPEFSPAAEPVVEASESVVEALAAVSDTSPPAETSGSAVEAPESVVETLAARSDSTLPAEADAQEPAAKTPSSEDLNVLEQMVLKAAKEQDEMKSVGIDPTSKLSGITIEETKDDDALTHKRRAEMRAMEVFYSEEPEKFFEHDEHVGEQDDLFEQRRSEMAALNAMLEAHANLSREIFHDKQPDVPDNEREKRKREFEALREYFAENPERFHEYVTMGSDDPNGTEELRTKILKIMEESRDVEAFEAKDGRVEDDSVIFHQFAPEAEKEKEPEPEPELEPYSITKEKPEEYVPPEFEASPYGDETSMLNYDTKHKGKLDVDIKHMHEDDTSLIKRLPDRNNKFGFIDRDKLRVVDRIPKHVLIAATVFAAFMPIVALYMYHYFNMNAEADYEDQRAASELAARAAYEESSSRKTEEPYRHAEATAGPVNANPPDNRGSGGGGDGAPAAGAVTDAELNSYHYTPPDHPLPAPTRTQEQRAQRALAQGEQMMLVGRADEAARIFADGLLEHPGNQNLRIRLARTYMQLKNFSAAKDVLISGMQQASNQAEFDLYLSIMRELPRGK